MATIDFGLMLRPHDAGHSMQDVIAYNQRCIQALKAGFTTLWLEDHLQVGEADSLECLSTLSYLAASHPQFKVGMLVLAQSYRNPALVAKMLANLQALSEGRVVLGIGAGWKEDEYVSYGYPFPANKKRLDQLEEAVQVIRALWTTFPASFEGQYYQVRDAYCAPQPKPMIPILIGGGGEKRTLALVASYADWWNFNSCPLEVYAHKLAVLKQHCERIGRDPSEIKLTYLSTMSVSEDPAKVVRHPQKHYIAGNAAEVTRELEQFRQLGVTHFIFRVPELASLEQFVEHVAPNFL
ncbi:LLM class flavin-dependent oxidoreductase [Ktedonosporobacter rubrisoli]|uniref:LLM class flavin-dependent oxidoreductase n=1 Tax=Ktedonosporobacter rubrisoli TaxID=2509675 RepID=A0A4P6K239_KTERU|nr:LLM class flavin-dependent oxidoreductase [Ktedonosporobacter rubrisoli]QBD82267.1 LLM class flavin-dependent oxidoreductase [Ktedonosporobacter rubrisoli]